MTLTVKCYVAMTRDNKIQMSFDLPTRDESRGIWVAKKIYINSAIYKEVTKIMGGSSKTWKDEPELFVFTINQ